MQNPVAVTYLPQPRVATLAMRRACNALATLPSNTTHRQAIAACASAAYSAARTHKVKLARGAAKALATIAVARYAATGNTLLPVAKQACQWRAK